MFVQYEHHGATVWVDDELKGFHQDYCLCYSCKFFKPDTPENCTTSQKVYELCVRAQLVLPVWECPIFQESEVVLIDEK